MWFNSTKRLNMKNIKHYHKYEYRAYFIATTKYDKKRGECTALIISDGFPSEKFCLDYIKLVFVEYENIIITNIEKI
jgi:hypothetical protein